MGQKQTNLGPLSYCADAATCLSVARASWGERLRAVTFLIEERLCEEA